MNNSITELRQALGEARYEHIDKAARVAVEVAKTQAHGADRSAALYAKLVAFHTAQAWNLGQFRHNGGV